MVEREVGRFLLGHEQVEIPCSESGERHVIEGLRTQGLERASSAFSRRLRWVFEAATRCDMPHSKRKGCDGRCIGAV